MRLAALAGALLSASEKAANIARKIRANQCLLSLLVQEKNEAEKNPKFVHDFKTLADVLIQEVTRSDLIKLFPCLNGQVFGEEDNTFLSAAEKAYTVTVHGTENDTAALLALILQGDDESARTLAAAAHEVVQAQIPIALQAVDCEVPDDDIAIWIDPIDSTEQYIAGIENPDIRDGVCNKGLYCVTVLIGAFSKSSGQPIAGVALRPFEARYPNGQWSGTPVWGVRYGDRGWSSVPEVVHEEQLHPKKVAVMSGGQELGSGDHFGGGFLRDWLCLSARGAGNKMLAVAQGMAGVYLCRGPSVFEWDACGPDAILRSLGGGILEYETALRLAIAHCQSGGSMAAVPFEHCQVKYRCKAGGIGHPAGGSDKHSLDKGIVAYRSRAHLEEFFSQVLLHSSE